jgi:uncharacterized protein
VTEFFASAGFWLLYGVWAVLLLASLLLTILGLGGNFFILALGFLYAAITGFQDVGWGLLLILLGLAVLGEVIESLLGLVYVAAKGATRYGVGGAFVGGLVGATAGSSVLPVIGTILGSFLGAFVGAMFGEYLRERRMEPSLRIGWHAFAGKMLATLIKFALGVEMVWLLLRRV